ncbi:MAG TPA: hypothetical protein VGQ53_06795, partial [Chitinophagaceae bacterium]|nr:hypothetical protein [Chitinophagaceae bacterium]
RDSSIKISFERYRNKLSKGQSAGQTVSRKARCDCISILAFFPPFRLFIFLIEHCSESQWRSSRAVDRDSSMKISFE